MGYILIKVLFYDVEVVYASHPIAKKFGVKAFPVMIEILSNGEVLIMASGSGFEKTKNTEGRRFR